MNGKTVTILTIASVAAISAVLAVFGAPWWAYLVPPIVGGAVVLRSMMGAFLH